MQYKVIVPDYKKLAKLYPHMVNKSPLDIEHGDIKGLIIHVLYIKGLIGDKKALISKLAPEYDRKDILKHYNYIMENINNYFQYNR